MHTILDLTTQHRIFKLSFQKHTTVYNKE